MVTGLLHMARNMLYRVRLALTGPHMLAFLPALSLAAFWVGGEHALLLVSLGVPMLFALASIAGNAELPWNAPGDAGSDAVLREKAERALTQALAKEQSTGMTTAALAVELDDFTSARKHYGARAAASMSRQAGERIKSALREGDHVVPMGESRFVIALRPTRHIDLDMLVLLSTRLQNVLGEPFSVDAARVYLSASVGFCLPDRAPMRSGAALMASAQSALEKAQASGGAAIRAFARKQPICTTDADTLENEIEDALETGQIGPWFQPQVATKSGEITGFEALARWQHPDRGLILPGKFLPLLEKKGLMHRLFQIMLTQSLKALREWDKQGLAIPSVSVNFSDHELSDPKLCEQVQWELDRFELSSDRLCVEILESVIAAPENDLISTNVVALGKLGCRIDLDDFGVGNASIASIRRFQVDRLKIDRSFIARIDRDTAQQDMVAAILTMAGQLDLETLAEGVETIGEHAMLGQLGCGHVQGFSIARPMAPEAVAQWVGHHNARQKQLAHTTQKAG